MSLEPQLETREPLSKERLRLWLKMLKATRAIESDLRERLRIEFQTTLPRFDVMAALSRHPRGLKMSELSGVLKVSNGNVTGIVERLTSDGFIIREAVPGDRRAARVRLTRRGEEEFAKQASAHEAWIDDLMDTVTGGQAADAMRIFDRIAPAQQEEH